MLALLLVLKGLETFELVIGTVVGAGFPDKNGLLALFGLMNGLETCY